MKTNPTVRPRRHAAVAVATAALLAAEGALVLAPASAEPLPEDSTAPVVTEPTEPTAPTGEPTDSGTEPADPGTEPADPGTEPADPGELVEVPVDEPTDVPDEEPAAPEPPSAPTALAIQAAPSAVRVSWDVPDVSGELVTDYRVVASVDGETWTEVPGDVSPRTWEVVGGLTPQTTYLVRVLAVADHAESGWSETLQVTTPAAPSVPVGLRAVTVTTNSTTVTWSTPTTSGRWVTDYEVAASTDGSTWTAVRGPVSTSRTRPVTGLQPGTRYLVRVRAVAGTAAGAWSAPLTVTTAQRPSAPRNVRVKSAEATTATVSWSAPSVSGALVTDYRLRVSADGGRTWTTVVEPVSTATSATVTGLAPRTRYLVEVVAVADTTTLGTVATITVTTAAEKTVKPVKPSKPAKPTKPTAKGRSSR